MNSQIRSKMMTNDNEPMANPLTQDTCYYNEPHHWITTLGSHLPSVQVCGNCSMVNRKDLQVQLDEAKAEGYEGGWKAGHNRGRLEGFRQGEERGTYTMVNIAKENIAAAKAEAAEEIEHLKEHIQDMGRGFDQRLERAWSEGKEAGREKAEAVAEEKIREARRIGHKQGVFEGLYRGAKVANQTNERAAAMNEAQATNQSAPSAPQASHKCAHAIRLAMHDGTDLTILFSNPIAQAGWKLRKMNGVDVMVIGHGVPRRTIPLINVKFFDLLTEDEL